MQVVAFLERCAHTNNHTTREAACACLAEVVSRAAPEAVRSRMPRILRTLLTCLRDDSWPVRASSISVPYLCPIRW